jgi:hypothetical protein
VDKLGVRAHEAAEIFLDTETLKFHYSVKLMPSFGHLTFLNAVALLADPFIEEGFEIWAR